MSTVPEQIQKVAAIIPTFKNAQPYCDLYRANNFEFPQDQEIEWTADFENYLKENYERIISYVDITQHRDYFRIARISEKVVTHLCGDFKRIQRISESIPDKKFGILFPGKSMYKSEGISWLEYEKRLNFLKSREKIIGHAYFFYMKNFENVLEDLEVASKYFNVNDIKHKTFYIYEPDDKDFIESLSPSDLQKLKEVFKNIFDSYQIDHPRHESILSLKENPLFSNTTDFFLPDGSGPRNWLQADVEKDCSNCNPMNSFTNECSNCYKHQNSNMFSLEAKEAYKQNLQRIRELVEWI